MDRQLCIIKKHLSGCGKYLVVITVLNSPILEYRKIPIFKRSELKYLINFRKINQTRFFYHNKW